MTNNNDQKQALEKRLKGLKDIYDLQLEMGEKTLFVEEKIAEIERLLKNE